MSEGSGNPFLPARIPYQFSLDGTQRLADRAFIFAFALLPAVLYVAIRAKYRRK